MWKTEVIIAPPPSDTKACHEQQYTENDHTGYSYSNFTGTGQSAICPKKRTFWQRRNTTQALVGRETEKKVQF